MSGLFEQNLFVLTANGLERHPLMDWLSLAVKCVLCLQERRVKCLSHFPSSVSASSRHRNTSYSKIVTN